jgi:hypothetical protein
MPDKGGKPIFEGVGSVICMTGKAACRFVVGAPYGWVFLFVPTASRGQGERSASDGFEPDPRLLSLNLGFFIKL